MAQGQVDDKPQAQHRFDDQVSVKRLAARRAGPRRMPASQRRIVHLQGEVTAALQPDQGRTGKRAWRSSLDTLPAQSEFASQLARATV